MKLYKITYKHHGSVDVTYELSDCYDVKEDVVGLAAIYVPLCDTNYTGEIVMEGNMGRTESGTVRIEDVTKDYPISTKKLQEALQKIGYGLAEITVICDLVETHYNNVTK